VHPIRDQPAPDYTRRMKTARYLLMMMVLVLVAACGTKGPLVLPDPADKTNEAGKPEKADEAGTTGSPAAP